MQVGGGEVESAPRWGLQKEGGDHTDGLEHVRQALKICGKETDHGD